MCPHDYYQHGQIARRNKEPRWHGLTLFRGEAQFEWLEGYDQEESEQQLLASLVSQGMSSDEHPSL